MQRRYTIDDPWNSRIPSPRIGLVLRISACVEIGWLLPMPRLVIAGAESRQAGDGLRHDKKRELH